MPQLILSNKQLKEIGFTYNKSMRRFTMPITNGVFYYNPKQDKYKWYQSVTIGDCHNGIWLDISSLQHLYALLQCFRVKFNLIMY